MPFVNFYCWKMENLATDFVVNYLRRYDQGLLNNHEELKVHMYKIAKKTVWRSAFLSKYSTILSNTLLQTAFSAILPTGYTCNLRQIILELRFLCPSVDLSKKY